MAEYFRKMLIDVHAPAMCLYDNILFYTLSFLREHVYIICIIFVVLELNLSYSRTSVKHGKLNVT